MREHAPSKAYSIEEVQAISRAAGSEQDAAIYLTAALTGLRRGELVALRWRDVDFAAELIRVEHSYDFEDGLVTPKGRRMRSVPMSPEVAQALARLEQRQLFTNRDSFDAAVAQAKVKRLTFHELRHTFGTIAANAALSGKGLQE